MYAKKILISSDRHDQSNLPEFVRRICEIQGLVDFKNLFAKDYVNYYIRYGHSPENLGLLKAFIVENCKRDAEAYLFSNEAQKLGGFTLTQVPPLMFLYEFINHEGLGIGSFVPYDETPHRVTDETGLVKISCPLKLVTNDPIVMKQNLSEFLAKPLSLF